MTHGGGIRCSGLNEATTYRVNGVAISKIGESEMSPTSAHATTWSRPSPATDIQLQCCGAALLRVNFRIPELTPTEADDPDGSLYERLINAAEDVGLGHEVVIWEVEEIVTGPSSARKFK